MTSGKTVELLKQLLVTFCILSLVLFAGCKASDDDDDDDDAPAAATCAAGSDLDAETLCLVIDGSNIGGTNADSATASLGKDPATNVEYDAGSDKMELAFAKDYENGATDYPTEMDVFDGYNILVFLDLKGTPLPTTELGTATTASSYIDVLMVSPTGTDDIYAAMESVSGSSASVTLTQIATSNGDVLEGDIDESVLCKVDPDAGYSATDNCATKITITEGSFKMTRDD